MAMILLFADGIKEKTQPAIYNTPIDALDFTPLLQDISDSTLSYIKLYLENLRERFIRHHWNQVIRQHTGYLPPELAKRGRGAQACMMSAMGSTILSPTRRNLTSKTLIKGRENYVRHVKQFSGTKEDVHHALYVIHKVYGLLEPGGASGIRWHNIVPIRGETRLAPTQFVLPRPYTKAYWIVTENETGDGHAMAFYSCGGNDYVFDNNNGPLLFPWRRLFQWINDNPEQEPRIGFIHSAYLTCIKVNYAWFPIVYMNRTDPTTGARTVRIGVLCQDGPPQVIELPYRQNMVWFISDMIVFESTYSTLAVEKPPLVALFPRLKQKGSGRNRNRSKRRTRKH